MIAEISRILECFRPCFSRGAAFNWFVILVMGFIVRLDHHGVTSIIRWLGLEPACYTSLLAFFRAASWRLDELMKRWLDVVISRCPLVKIDGRLVLFGDGIKISKEARKMPGVKKLHQDSDNSGKAPFINGHHHGVIGIAAGCEKKIFCVPLRAEIHEGVERLRQMQGKTAPIVGKKEKVTVTTLMASMASELASSLQTRCLIVLDAYFAVGPVFLILKNMVDSQGDRMLHIVTRAKNNAVAYEDPPAKAEGRSGRPRKYGTKRKLMKVFKTCENQFEELMLEVYGQCKTLSFLCLDLMWKPIGEKVRFVLVRDGDKCFILMCSDLAMPAAEIIRAYSYRFKIEVGFKVLKHVMGVFFYHFWTSAWPRLNRKGKSDLSAIEDPRSIRLIGQTAEAIDRFVAIGCIATGILQILALSKAGSVWENYMGWLRTVTSEIPSEEVVQSVVREEFFHNFRIFNRGAIYRIIMSKSRKVNDDVMREAA